MASYQIEMAEIGTVRISKKRGMRSIRLRIMPDGQIAVSAPWYVPRVTIMNFIESKKSWLAEHQTKRKVTFYDGLRFGRNLTLRIHENAPRRRSRLSAYEVNVYLENELSANDQEQIAFIKKSAHRALQNEAEHYLLPRLLEISKHTELEFNQSYVKHLIGRWGSCDSRKNILLSFFLVQLPDELIDYVIIHELAHTKHMNHSASFWQLVEKHCPHYKTLRKQAKQHDPRIIERA